MHSSGEKTLCAYHHCTLVSQAVIIFCTEIPQHANSRHAHKFQQGQAAYTESEACLLTKGPAGRIPRHDYSTRLQQQQSVSLQVAQMLDRQKVQRIASDGLLLAVSSRCVIDSRHVDAVLHQVCRSTASMVP